MCFNNMEESTTKQALLYVLIYLKNWCPIANPSPKRSIVIMCPASAESISNTQFLKAFYTCDNVMLIIFTVIFPRHSRTFWSHLYMFKYCVFWRMNLYQDSRLESPKHWGNLDFRLSSELNQYPLNLLE